MGDLQKRMVGEAGFLLPEQRPQTSLEGVLSGTNCLRSEREFSFLPQAGVVALGKGRLPEPCSVWGPLQAGLPVSPMILFPFLRGPPGLSRGTRLRETMNCVGFSGGPVVKMPCFQCRGTGPQCTDKNK